MAIRTKGTNVEKAVVKFSVSWDDLEYADDAADGVIVSVTLASLLNFCLPEVCKTSLAPCCAVKAMKLAKEVTGD